MAMDVESIRAFVAPLVTSLGLDLYDVELTGAGHARSLRVVVDKAVGSAAVGSGTVGSRTAGSGTAGEETGGVDLDTIADATRLLAPALTAAAMLRDSDVLEVSSPGLERPLRRPEHYRSAIGLLVSAKYLRDGETVRERATVTAVDDDGVELTPEGAEPGTAGVRLAYADIVACRTVFEWGPPPRPGRGSKPGKGSGQRQKENSRS
jgi:ribosome maturation factor RimP